MIEQDPNATPPPAGSEPFGGPPAAEKAEPAEQPYSFWRWLGELVVLVALAFIVAYVLKLFIVQPFYIPSGSMEPTLMPGDRILVNKFVYRFGPARPGDIVVFEAPNDSAKRDFIKRIVAVAGQTVEGRAGDLYINGQKVAQPYVAQAMDGSSFGPVEVPAGSVFVMGDNRTNSQDSRYFGALSVKSILGKAFIIYWPLTLPAGQHRLL